MTFTLKVQGQEGNLLNINQNWSFWHETKCKQIGWVLGIKYDQRVWPWHWPRIFKVKCNLHFRPQAWPWPWISMVKFEIAVFQEWEGRLTSKKYDESQSFKTIAMTFSWPMWGVKIYRIVTGVTSDVGVLSIHLVYSHLVASTTLHAWLGNIYKVTITWKW